MHVAGQNKLVMWIDAPNLNLNGLRFYVSDIVALFLFYKLSIYKNPV